MPKGKNLSQKQFKKTKKTHLKPTSNPLYQAVHFKSTSVANLFG